MKKKSKTEAAGSSIPPTSAGPAEQPGNITAEKLAGKLEKARAAALAQVGDLMEATWPKVVEHFQAAFLDFVEANPDAPGKKFKFSVGLTIKLSPMVDDVAVQSKLSFGRRRTFNTETRAASAKPADLFDGKGAAA